MKIGQDIKLILKILKGIIFAEIEKDAHFISKNVYDISKIDDENV